jgi:hypothetical protein
MERITWRSTVSRRVMLCGCIWCIGGSGYFYYHRVTLSLRRLLVVMNGLFPGRLVSIAKVYIRKFLYPQNIVLVLWLMRDRIHTCCIVL